MIVYKDNIPVACGAFKEYSVNCVELKRIFVIKEKRQQGLAKLVIKELEVSAKNMGYKYAVLGTGKKQPEATSLYKSIGYNITQNYEPYVGNTNIVCMKKDL